MPRTLLVATGRSGLLSGIWQIIASVVSISAAFDDAFCSAEQVTLGESIAPVCGFPRPEPEVV